MLKRKHLLLCLSCVFFSIPIIIEETRNLISIGMLYFFGMFFILLNFPCISIFLTSKPHYIEDLDNQKYREFCIILQNVFLSILFGVIIDIFYLNKLHTRSVLENLAIVGGNMALIFKIQNFCSKLLLIVLSWCNSRASKALENHLPKRKTSIDLTENNKQFSTIDSI